MINKLHKAWIILAAAWLSMAPTHVHAAHTYRLQTADLSGVTLHNKNSITPRTSAAGCASSYTVRKGDTLAKIARRCGVSVASIKNVNGLSGTTIRVGQVLVIGAPRAVRPVATPAPTPTIESTVSPW